MSSAPVRTPCSCASSVTGTSSIGSRCRSRQVPAHLSGVAPVTKPRRKVTLSGQTSNRSSSMTLVHAATKSSTNFASRVLAGVDLGEGAQLAVRAEDQVDVGRGPLHLAAGEVADLVDVLVRLGVLPLGARRQEVDEEVVRQRPGRSVRTPCCGAAEVGAERPQAADQHGHLGSREVEHVRAVEQQGLRLELLALAEVVAEAVGPRLEDRERLDVGLLLGRVGAARGERHGHVVAGLPRRLLHRGGAGEHDQVGQRDLRAAGAVELLLDPLERVQDGGQLGRVVGGPAALRLEPDAGAVRAAPLVGGAERRRRGPRRAHQLVDGQPAVEDLGLEVGHVGVARPARGRRPGPGPATAAARRRRGRGSGDRAHVAVQQLVPGLGEGEPELVEVRVEAARDLLVLRVHPEREVGGQHRRAVLLRRVVRRRGWSPRRPWPPTGWRRRGSWSAPTRGRTGCRRSRCPTGSGCWSR